LVAKHVHLVRQIWDLGMFRQKLKRDPNAREYTDLSLTPIVADEFDSYEMFKATESAKSAVSKVRHPDEPRETGRNVLVTIKP
jgi:hypothetical protein